MKNNEKGQGMVEFAFVLIPLLILIMGVFAVGVIFHDWMVANDSAHDASHAAAIYIWDGSGKTCYDRAMEARGNPGFIMVEEATFTIEPCPDQEYWVGSTNAEIVATWELVVNPPIPFVYSNFGFPLPITLEFGDNFR